MDGFESREIRRSNEFLRTRASPGEGPCGTRPAATSRRSGVVSVEGVESNGAGGWAGMAAGIPAASTPPRRCPDTGSSALNKGTIPSDSRSSPSL